MASCFVYGGAAVYPTESREQYRTINSDSLIDSFYRGEGNATFVVALPNEKKVLRLKKSDPKNGDLPSNDDGERRVWLARNFHRNVISHLMGNYVKEPEIVGCNSGDLKSHLRLFELHRPAHRRHKIVIENFATTLPDYTLLPAYLLDKIPPSSDTSTFSVEIKPKEEDDGNLALSKCEYCHPSSIDNFQGYLSPSTYCPRCLFSGQLDRMGRSITGLILKSRNYLKVFENGHCVLGEKSTDTDLYRILEKWRFPGKSMNEKVVGFVELIRGALLQPFPQPDSTFDYPKSSKTPIPSYLPKDSVLERIQRVQRIYRCSVETIHPIYAKCSSKLNDEMVYTQNVNIADNVGCHSTPSFQELRDLRNYLIYRIARDCSIIMAFREIDRSTVQRVPRENVIQLSNDRCFLINNAITDLDPKSVSCIEKHHLKMQKISEARIRELLTMYR